MAEDYEGISETQITFYRVQGHNHDGENSSKIDLSKYDLSDIVDMSQFNSAVLSSVENAVIKPKGIVVGIGDAVLDLDGSDPNPPTGVTVTSTADPDSPGNILINVAWDIDADGANNTYVVELWKSTTGISGTYIVSRSAESTGNSHIFEWVDNRSGDVGSVYYKVRVMSVSPMGIRSVAYEATVAPASDSSIPGAITFNDDFSNFDEGLKTTFRGFFVKLDDSSEFDVKQGRGEYEWQVSTNNTAGNFDAAANLKASGRSKSTYIVVNSLEVRASASAAKTNYYLRVRAIDSSNNSGPWVYYRSTAGGGSNGAGSSTVGNASAITILEISGEVDIQDGTITADQIQADTITADQIEAGTITADEIDSGTITADKFVSTLLFTAGGDMKSSDYSEVSGSEAGWKIEGGVSGGDSGTAVFQSVTVRGVVNATTGYIGGTDGWEIDSNVIKSGTGSTAVRIGSGGSSGVAFIRLGTKAGWNDTDNGIWMDPTNGLIVGHGASMFTASTAGVITANAGNIGGWILEADAIRVGAKDVSGYTAGGITLSSANGGSLHAENFYLDTSGNAFFKGRIESSVGLIGGWTIDSGKIHSGTDIELGLTNQAVSVGGGRGVMRRYVTGGAGDGDLKIGIDASAGYDPVYGTAGDILMWWDHDLSLAKFSIGNKLLFDGANLTITDGALTGPTIQTSTSGARLSLTPVSTIVEAQTGTAQAGSTTTITLKSADTQEDDYYNGWKVTLTSGTGSGQTTYIVDYVKNTKVATVSPSWTPTNPNSTSVYRIELEQHTFLQGHTGDGEQDYPGFLFFYHDLDDWANASSRHWGKVAISAPRYSATFGYAGFNFGHSNDGWGRLDFGLPNNSCVFQIRDTGSSSTPTNTFNKGGITIVSGTPASTNNTLYADGTTLKWHGAAVGGGSSNTYGTALTETSGTVNHDDYATAGSYGGVGNYVREVTVNAQGHVTGIDIEPESTIAETFYWVVAAGGTSGTTQIGPSTETLTFNGAGATSVTRGTNTIDIALDLSELPDGTAAIVGSSDELIYLDSGVQKRKMINEITLSDFSNDAGFTTLVSVANAGYITAASSNTLTNKGGDISQWTNNSGYVTSSHNHDNTTHLATYGARGSPGYAFSSDSNTGMYRSASDEITWSCGASDRMKLSQTALYPLKPIYAINGDATDPAYAFSGDTDMGFYRAGSYMYMQAGNVGSPAWEIAIGTSSVWMNPASGSADDYIKRASSGQLFYTTSSQRYKERIETVDTDDALTRIKALRPVDFYFNSEAVDVSNEMTAFQKKRGFIAEELSDVDHWYATYGWYHSDDPESADYTKRWMGGPEEVPPELSESSPVHWDYEAVIADVVSVVQNLEARLAALEA